MRVTRPDTTSMILTAVCVVGIVLLAILNVPIPDVLTFVAMGALGIGGGTALNTSTSSSDSAAGRIAESLASLEQLIGGARRASSAPAAARPPAPASPIPTQAGPSAAAPAGAAAR